jgi:hypothetical protein
MPPRAKEGRTQQEVLHLLRYRIDTAIAHPSKPGTAAVLEMVAAHPHAMRSLHVRRNLGQRRWAWLNEHGIYEVRGDITPDITT